MTKKRRPKRQPGAEPRRAPHPKFLDKMIVKHNPRRKP